MPAGPGDRRPGDSRRGSKITPGGAREQGSIHRPLPAGSGTRLATPGGDLTRDLPGTYRFSVTRCRRVPHVRARAAISRSAHGRAVPVVAPEGNACASPDFIGRSTGRPAGVIAPDTSERTREQAHLPAEQPTPSQGARLPASHAHSRRSLHPVRPASQGPQGPGRLSRQARRQHHASGGEPAHPAG